MAEFQGLGYYTFVWAVENDASCHFSLAPTKKQRDGSGKKGNSTFSFLTSNETEKYQSKKLKIRPEIKLTQVDFLKKVAFP